jgi:hypothetical protein
MHKLFAVFRSPPSRCAAGAIAAVPGQTREAHRDLSSGRQLDLLARVFGQKLSEIQISGRGGEQTGAAGSIGMDYAAKQPNDGYSFVGNIGPAAVNPCCRAPYNVERDFVAICPSPPDRTFSSHPNVPRMPLPS